MELGFLGFVWMVEHGPGLLLKGTSFFNAALSEHVVIGQLGLACLIRCVRLNLPDHEGVPRWHPLLRLRCCELRFLRVAVRP